MKGLKNIKKYFLTGIGTILPLILTIWFLKWFLAILDKFLFRPFLHFIKNYFEYPNIDIYIRIAVFILVILLLSFLGFLINFLFFRKIVKKIESMIFKFPFIGKIYNSIKQLSNAIVGQGKNVFKKVVLIEYPSEGKFCIGFLTSEAEQVINQAANKELVAVFIPTTPNPTSGFLIYYPKESIRVLDMSAEEGMRVIISAGTASVKSYD